MSVTNDFSVDGTQDIVKRIARKKCRIIFPHDRLSEPHTRNLYTRFVLDQFPNDWLFRIDSDEVLHDAKNDFAWLRSSDAQRYNIIYIRRDDNEVYRRRVTASGWSMFHPCFYGGISGLHYAETHAALRDAEGDKVKPKYPSASLKEAWLHHIHDARSSLKLDATGYYDIYQRWRYEKMTRPLISYLPYPIVKAAKRAMLRGNIDPNRALFCFAIGNRYLLGYDRRYTG